MSKQTCPECCGYGTVKVNYGSIPTGELVPCRECDGHGKEVHRNCSYCNGSGKFYGRDRDEECSRCNGSGRSQDDCRHCDGSGLVTEAHNSDSSKRNHIKCPTCGGTGTVEDRV